MAARRRRLDLGLAIPEHLLDVGMSGYKSTPGSPHMCGRLICVLKFARSDAMFRVAERVNDGDGHALALILRRVERAQVGRRPASTPG